MMKIIKVYKIGNNEMCFDGYINIDYIIKIGTSYQPHFSVYKYYLIDIENNKGSYYINEFDYNNLIKEVK